MKLRPRRFYLRTHDGLLCEVQQSPRWFPGVRRRTATRGRLPNNTHQFVSHSDLYPTWRLGYRPCMDVSLFDRLRQLHLRPDGYAIFGSGPLAIRNIIPACNDLDILCKQDVWDVVSREGVLKFLPDYDVTVASFFDGAISFGTEWGIGNFNVIELIETAEMIDSLPFVRLEYVVRYKTIRSSATDLQHLSALQASSRR